MSTEWDFLGNPGILIPLTDVNSSRTTEIPSDGHESTSQERQSRTTKSSSRQKATKAKGYPQVPHRGALCRIDTTSSNNTSVVAYHQYLIEILLENGATHELWFDRQDYDFMSHLFAILDTESRGSVGRAAMKDFVTLRCPVFWRRDEDLRKLDKEAELRTDRSPTFDEVWLAVAQCCKEDKSSTSSLDNVELGVEGWLVFCRFVALAQYLEAKRRFSARHLQQTMRHRNSPRGSEVVVVDVPPPAPPIQLTPLRLAEHEKKGQLPLPLPELDLDHSLIAAHDALRKRSILPRSHGTVKLALFGSKPKAAKILASTADVEFALTYSTKGILGEEVIVRRSFADMKWLNDTFKSHRGLGGTLCGRILPPFPPAAPSSLATHLAEDKTLQSAIDGTGAAVKAAAAGVGMITNVAKSIWGSYKPSFGREKKSENPPSQTSRKASTQNIVISDKYYNPNSRTGKARHLERYLNYLLEHPALSTSFPLNTILKASQSGLESAKLFLEDHARIKQKVHSQSPQMDDWRTTSGGANPASKQAPNLTWVRTAAQAAMALQVHGLLETTGLPSASARLQHASLPSFNQSSRHSGWADEDGLGQESPYVEGDGSVTEGAESFEHGVVEVEAESDVDGYDLLPLPIPAPERRILCAGSTPQVDPGLLILDGNGGHFAPREERFHYGVDGDRVNLSEQCEVESAFLGDFPVDENIDKLREVIGSVDNTLHRCLSASGGIGEARSERLAFHLDLVRGFDSWEGLRGRFITQRALLKGVNGLEQSKEVAEESDLDIVDDVSWQASLASSAVAAAEDVRSTVRAARTAANAKAAADCAAFAAQSACEGEFGSIDEARAAQTRASIAQSHAIHAAVVEHEANTAKRRAALALAHDVKTWNVHRKRELLRSCLAHAKSQHVATRRAVDAWSCLRDGYLGSAIIPEARMSTPEAAKDLSRTESSGTSRSRDRIRSPSELRDEDPIAQIYSEIPPDMESAISTPTITAVDHYILSTPQFAEEAKLVEESSKLLMAIDEEESLPIIDAAPVLETMIGEMADVEGSEADNILSSSMQSLVDGLMTWGGHFDSEEDLNLPIGMATSIVLEGSGIAGVN